MIGDFSDGGGKPFLTGPGYGRNATDLR